MDAQPDPLAQLKQALAQTGRVIDGVRPEQLENPTPCRDWNVRTLLGHVVEKVALSSRVVRGETTKGSERADGAVEDWPASYRQAAGALLAAWSRPGALLDTYPSDFGPAPASVALNISILELVVHGWDLAKATGQMEKLEPSLGEAALILAQTSVPAERRGPRGDFDAVIPVPEEANAYDRLAGFMGRQP